MRYYDRERSSEYVQLEPADWRHSCRHPINEMPIYGLVFSLFLIWQSLDDDSVWLMVIVWAVCAISMMWDLSCMSRWPWSQETDEEFPTPYDRAVRAEATSWGMTAAVGAGLAILFLSLFFYFSAQWAVLLVLSASLMVATIRMQHRYEQIHADNGDLAEIDELETDKF